MELANDPKAMFIGGMATAVLLMIVVDKVLEAYHEYQMDKESK